MKMVQWKADCISLVSLVDLLLLLTSRGFSLDQYTHLYILISTVQIVSSFMRPSNNSGRDRFVLHMRKTAQPMIWIIFIHGMQQSL
jgi:hypothetical protein